MASVEGKGKRWAGIAPRRCGLGAMLCLLGALAVAGCASRVVPPELSARVNRELSFEELSQNPNRYLGELVVYGGVIISSKNRAEGTELEIMQKPLDRTDEPLDVDTSHGRFLALYPGYLETAVYTKDRRITVVAEVTGREERPVGEMRYAYPTLRVHSIRLWPAYAERPYYYPHPYYWYGPRYDPYWHRYGYPYYPYYPYPYGW